MPRWDAKAGTLGDLLTEAKPGDCVRNVGHALKSKREYPETRAPSLSAHQLVRYNIAS